MSKPSRWPLPADGIRFVVPGFVERFMASHPLTRGCFPVAMGYYPVATGHKMQRPVHDDHLIIYCTEGRGALTASGFDGDIEAGDLIILPAGVTHAYHADKEVPWTIYWCHFKGSVSADFVEVMGDVNSCAVAKIGHSAGVLATFTSILGARQTGYNSAVLVHAANQLRQLLSLLPLEIQAHRLPHTHGLNVDKVQSMMWENISAQLTLDELAESVNLSKYHFSAQYKRLTGHSPIKHFIHLKMEHACFLLDTTEMSVSEIAAELGYDDSLYFSRLFKKTLGVPPKVYRVSH